MSDLSEKTCKACESGVRPYSIEEAKSMLKKVHQDWQLDESTPEITRQFKFKNYYQTIAFVNALAWISHQEDHHPNLEVSYNKCSVHYNTHAIDGLSENDFICAAKLDQLVL